ncbi:MAG: ATP-binding protein [Candidatus Sericytochromatia bacterium]
MPTTTSVYYYLSAPAAPTETTKETEMLRVSLAINAGTSVDGLIDVLFGTLDGLVPFERIGVAVLRPDGVLVLSHVRSKLPIVWDKGASARLEGSSLEPIVRERKIRIINDLDAYYRDHPGSKTAPLLLREGMRASLTLPLTTSTGIVGVMFFSSTRPRSYGPEHVDFLRSLAAGIGIAFERARLLDELRLTNEQLKTLDQLKTNFLSNLSHELRTPLSELMGSAYLLEDELADRLSAEQQGRMRTLLSSAGRLNGLLNDLFDYTALEAGRFPLDRVPVDVGPLLEEVLDDARPSITHKGLGLTLELAPEPLLVDGDPPRLAQVFRALLDNAGKFTPPPGDILVRARRLGPQVVVDVVDTGIGVPYEDQDHVFDKFFQVDSGANRTHGGTGLGLALAKAIVLGHGGVILLKSAPGSGSTATVQLPASKDAD